MNKHIKHYEHVYARVRALKLSEESQSEIVSILKEDVKNGSIITLDMETDGRTGIYKITFRYKTSSAEEVLDPSIGSYLVIRKDNTKVAMTPKEFEEMYFEVDVVDAFPLNPPIVIDPDLDPDFGQMGPDELAKYALAGFGKAGEAVLFEPTEQEGDIEYVR